MKIGVAVNKEQYKKCYDFLKAFGTQPLSESNLFYVEDDNGIILACAGQNKETGSMIEPFQSVNDTAAYKLFYYMQGMITGLGYKTIRAISANQKVHRILEEEGWTLFTPSIKEYIRSI